MAALRHISQSALQTYLQTLDASAEVRVVHSPADAQALLVTPPVGKLFAAMDAGGYNILLVFSTTGTIAGLGTVKCKGNQFITTSTVVAARTLATPVTVITHESPFALQDYLNTLGLEAAVVTVYADESAAVDTGPLWGWVVSLGRLTKIEPPLPRLLFCMDKGGEYTTIVKP